MIADKKDRIRTAIPWWLLAGGVVTFLFGIFMFRSLRSSDAGSDVRPAMVAPASADSTLQHANVTEPVEYQPQELLPPAPDGKANADAAIPPGAVLL